MPGAWRGILQAASDPPTGLLVALAIVVAFVLILAARGIFDWLRGPDRETATYRLVEAGEGLALVEGESPQAGRLIGLDEPAMRDFIDRVEVRNEMRLHAVISADGDKQAWKDWRARDDRATPDGVLIEDSKGMVEIDRQGRVTAQPPMDEAVRGDLLEVLESVV